MRPCDGVFYRGCCAAQLRALWAQNTNHLLELHLDLSVDLSHLEQHIPCTRERERGRRGGKKKKRMKNTQQHKVIRESWKKTEEEKKLRRHPGVQAHASNTRTRKKKTYGTSDFVTGDNEDAHDESWHEATEDRADETTTSDDEHEGWGDKMLQNQILRERRSLVEIRRVAFFFFFSFFLWLHFDVRQTPLVETKSTPQRKVTVSTQGGGKEKKKRFRKHKMTKKKGEIRRLMHLRSESVFNRHIYLQAASSECAVHCREKGTQRATLSEGHIYI